MSFYSRYILPHLFDFALSRPFLAEERKLALADVQGEVLEIGFGTGLNLAHYPPATKRVVALDPQPMLRRRVSRRIAAAPMPVEVMWGDAAQLPFADAAFDSVVSTFTLCSVADVAVVLAEIRRVLRPGGRFHFLEHGRSQDASVARRQDRWNGVQRYFGGGCNLNRPLGDMVTQNGYQFEQYACYELPKLPRLASTLYRGVAVAGTQRASGG